MTGTKFGVDVLSNIAERTTVVDIHDDIYSHVLDDLYDALPSHMMTNRFPL